MNIAFRPCLSDHDHENCPPPPPPGPPKPNNDGTYEEGISRGVHEAAKIWHDTGCDCVNVWGYEDQIEEMLESKFADSSADTDKQKDYKRGVQDGADLVVEEHERKCVDDSPAECVELGEAAAQSRSMIIHVNLLFNCSTNTSLCVILFSHRL